MEQSNAEMYTVAWFKIAECVSRGEKERALGVYRLLAHSLNDSALATQLEGDILLFFNTSDALEKYQNAAQCYTQTGRLFKAACVYEHMLTLSPGNDHYRDSLIHLYDTLSLDSKKTEHQQARKNSSIL